MKLWVLEAPLLHSHGFPPLLHSNALPHIIRNGLAGFWSPITYRLLIKGFAGRPSLDKTSTTKLMKANGLIQSVETDSPHGAGTPHCDEGLKPSVENLQQHTDTDKMPPYKVNQSRFAEAALTVARC